MKTYTIRLSDRTATLLVSVARLDGESANQVVRDALELYIQKRFADPAFQQRVRRSADELLAELDQEGAP